MTKLTRLEEFGVFRRFLPMIGLAAALVFGLVPAPARAQVNIDQGKPPSEIFESDCATCHKSARGLADGKNSLMLSGFLREHYTASREQAAALAAYVLGAGGSAPAAQKPGTEHAKVEPGEPKAAGHPEDHPATASRGHKQEPESAAPAAVVTAPAPVMATPAANETPSSAEAPSQSSNPPPSPSSAQSQGPEGGTTTSAAAPTEAEPSDSTPVPRDHIPD